MLSYSVLFLSLALSAYLIRKDIAERDGVSKAVWIPTLWAGILMSRPLSMWLNFGGGEDSLEGSPLDRLFYFGMILSALVVLMRRRLVWPRVLSSNWSIVFFYGYLLISVAWAPDSFVSFKRWFKDLGNIFVGLVILTEANPEQALRAVFARSAYVLMPLSIVFLRYFPDLGRRYLRRGDLEVVGVTTQKNSLGILVVICGLVLLWDWFERTNTGSTRRGRLERYLPFGFVIIGAYLLHLCDSKTSILCLGLGAIILLASRFQVLRRKVSALGFISLAGLLIFWISDSIFDIKTTLLELMGRDASLTGRTDVWRELLALNTDPFFGTGFCSFWSNKHYLSRLPDWVSKSAHNGYLEMYIDGGYLALFFLGLMLLNVAFKINQHLAEGSNYALLRFAVFIAVIIGDISESHWGRMSPLGFLFLLTSIGYAPTANVADSDYAEATAHIPDDPPLHDFATR
jgi:O-antigen ligase